METRFGAGHLDFSAVFVNPEALASRLSGKTQVQRAGMLRSLVLEEVGHNAGLEYFKREATAAGAKTPADIAAFIALRLYDVADRLPADVRETVRKAYFGDNSTRQFSSDMQMASEYTRQLLQMRRGYSLSEEYTSRWQQFVDSARNIGGTIVEYMRAFRDAVAKALGFSNGKVKDPQTNAELVGIDNLLEAIQNGADDWSAGPMETANGKTLRFYSPDVEEAGPFRRFSERVAGSETIDEGIRKEALDPRDVRGKEIRMKEFQEFVDRHGNTDAATDAFLRGDHRLNPDTAVTAGIQLLDHQNRLAISAAKAGDEVTAARARSKALEIVKASTMQELTQQARALQAAKDFGPKKVLTDYVKKVTEDRDRALGEDLKGSIDKTVDAIKGARTDATEAFIDKERKNIEGLEGRINTARSKNRTTAPAEDGPIWERLAKAAGDRLAKLGGETGDTKEKAPLANLADRTFKRFSEIVQDSLGKERELKPKDPLRNTNTIRDALTNYPELERAWQTAKDQIVSEHGPAGAARRAAEELSGLFPETMREQAKGIIEKYLGRENPTSGQLAEILKAGGVDDVRAAREAVLAVKDVKDSVALIRRLQPALDRGLGAPFTMHQLEGALREKGVDLTSLVRKYGVARDRDIQKLAQDFVKNGVRAADADKLAKYVEDGIRKLAADRAQRAIDSIVRQAKTPRTRDAVRSSTQKLIELSNLGVLSNEEAYQAVAKKLSLPSYSPEVAAEITRRVDEMQEMLDQGRKGFQVDQAEQNLLTYLAEQHGKDWENVISGLLYGQMLSGVVTHAKNILSNTINAVGEISTMHIANSFGENGPGLLKGLPSVFAAYGRGLATGFTDAKAVLTTGQTRTKLGEKVKVAAALEQDPFKGGISKYLNLYKYVFRGLAAADMVFYRGAQEVRAHMLAERYVRENEKVTDPVKVSQRVAEILYQTDSARADAVAQAGREGLKGLKKDLRVAEIIEQKVSEAHPDIVTSAAEFAARSTFNHQPDSTLLGGLSRSLKGFANSDFGAEKDGERNLAGAATRLAIKTVVPFYDVICNVVDTAVDYTPLGFHRMWTLESRNHGDRKAQQAVKQAVGALLLTGVVALSKMHDDENEPSFRLHGAGPLTPQQLASKKETGWIPYSIQVGDKFYSYQNTPLSLLFSVAGNYLDAERYGGLGDKDLASRLVFAGLSTGAAITDMSFLSGVSDLMSAMTRGNVEGRKKAMENWIARTATTAVTPGGNLTRQIEKFFNPTDYQASTLAQMLMRNTPVVRTALKPKLNAFGDPVQNSPLDAFGSSETNDPVWSFLAHRGLSVQVPNVSKLGDRMMTEDEKYQLIQQSGPMIKSWLADAEVQKTLAGLDAEKAQDVIDQVVSIYRRMAKAEIAAKAAQAGTLYKKQPTAP